jgi:group I intron endonuclease
MMGDPMSSSAGIYQWRNSVNGRAYVGSAVNLDRRRQQHEKDLKRGAHVNQKLQRAWTKYGAEAFAWEVIEHVLDRAELLAREQFWIDQKRCVSYGYNIAPVAGSMLGFKHSEESRIRMSKAQAGKTMSPEVIEKIAAALRGRPKSKEHAAKVGKAAKGRKHSQDCRDRMSAARKGRTSGPCKEETKKKIAAAQQGVPRKPWTDERKMAVSLAMTGRKMSPEAIEKTRLKQTGKVVSEETKARMSEAAKRRAPASAECRAKLSSLRQGRSLSDEVKAKISAAHKGKKRQPLSEDVKAKLSASMMGRQWTPEQIAKRIATKRANAAGQQK